ncbi:MAG: DNA repair protein RecO [Candidatus Nealsonbacteria bacterium]|nr:DNA repair protein RecO [Candidatus Nealsonbacteria bacterium]
MFTHYRTQGFILKKNDRGESNQLLTIYTKDFGKLEILGRAIRKISSKLRSGAELFYLSEIEFIQGKTHKTLTDAILINNFKNLRKDLTRLTITYKISEVFDRLVSGQESDKKLWQLLNETFTKLNDCQSSITEASTEVKKKESSSTVDCQLLYHYFLWNFLSLLGYQSGFYRCSLCQKRLFPEKLYFSAKEGGIICSQCQKKTKSETLIVFPDIVKIIRILLKKDWTFLGKLKVEIKDLNSLRTISNYYLSEVLEQVE